MLGDSSSVLSSSGDVAVTAMHEGGGGGGGGGSGGSVNNSGELLDDNNKGGARGGDMEMERGFGANRWPRQETLALLKIRSDMDAVFRDSSSKSPLWEEVSRKLAELGYHRSAKKCKEKFENVYKYHKRTKDGRTGKQDKNKTYRFFDQLEALDNNTITSNQPPLPPATTTTLQHQTPPPPMPAVVNSNPIPSTAAAGGAGGGGGAPMSGSIISTVPSTAHHVSMSHHQYNIAPTANNNYVHSTQPLSSPNNPTVPPNQNTNTAIINPSSSLHHNQIRTTQHSAHPTDALSYSTSSSTSSDEELGAGSRRKRKWRDFFEKLMRDVIEKQEAMQKKFMDEIERREHERMVREEAWRMQEMARLDREREILAQERSTAAAKDAALMAFLQKVAEQKNPAGAHPPTSTGPLESSEAPAQGQALQQQQKPTQPQQLQVHPISAPAPVSMAVAAPLPIAQYHPGTGNVVVDNQKGGNGENSALAMSSSRWPKVEVEALIKLRANLDAKYQDNGPKGPLWEEISSAMRKLGYNRSAKRCKEKWENINKYFKKVKESNKKRSEDSKTCPYFHQLDALYKEKNRLEHSSSSNNNNNNNIRLSSSKPESSSSMAAPLMVAPEQQWPPVQPPPRQPDSVMEDADSENMDQNNHEDEDDDEEDDEGEYEIVPNRPSSIGAAME